MVRETPRSKIIKFLSYFVTVYFQIFELKSLINVEPI